MKLKRRFTKWYIKKGYTYGYDFSNTPVYTDGIFCTPLGMASQQFKCPWWVKPFLILFSPSVYYAETIGKIFAEGFAAGLKSTNAVSANSDKECNRRADNGGI